MYHRHKSRGDKIGKQRDSAIYSLFLVFSKYSEQRVAMEWAFSTAGVNKK